MLMDQFNNNSSLETHFVILLLFFIKPIFGQDTIQITYKGKTYTSEEGITFKTDKIFATSVENKVFIQFLRKILDT